MDSLLDREEIIPLVANDEDALPIDILDRQEILDQLMSLLTTLSAVRSSCSFALNGKWGSGKSFVLERLERRLQNYQAGQQFIVFHYNCWQYDYYDEPLIAIVSAMLDNVDESIHILSSEIREKLHHGYGVVKGIAKSFFENKIGITIEDTYNKQDYDSYYAFHQIIEKARDGLSELAKDQTLVIVVDELDRCLPDYAIKILERLHHLFSGINNAIVILAIDQSQLDNAVTQIFGDRTDTKSYLKKFINFEVNLGIGKVNSSFIEKHKDYTELFDAVSNIRTPVEEFITIIFSEIEVRTQERLMERIKIAHNLLFEGDRKDHFFMCLELMVGVLSYFKVPVESLAFNIDPDNSNLHLNDNFPGRLKQYLIQNWPRRNIVHILPEHSFRFQYPIGIPELLIYGLEKIKGEDHYKLPNNLAEHFVEEKYIEGLKQVNKLLGIIQ